MTAEPYDGNLTLKRGRVYGVNIGDRISVGRFERIADFLNYVITTLRLEQWVVYLYDEGDDTSGKTATMNSRTDTWDAGLWLGDKFFDDEKLDDEFRKVALVHEMLHLHFEQAWNFVEDSWDNMLGKEAREIAMRAFRERMETGIDALAWSVAKMMPRQFVLDEDTDAEAAVPSPS